MIDWKRLATLVYMTTELIFVYNADTGFFNGLTDFAHKIISPKTYNCHLCKLTYGNVGMKKDWKAFIESLNTQITFLHRDEFRKQRPNNLDELPAIFYLKESDLNLLMTATELNRITDLQTLIDQVKSYSSKI